MYFPDKQKYQNEHELFFIENNFVSGYYFCSYLDFNRKSYYVYNELMAFTIMDDYELGLSILFYL